MNGDRHKRTTDFSVGREELNPFGCGLSLTDGGTCQGILDGMNALSIATTLQHPLRLVDEHEESDKK